MPDVYSLGTVRVSLTPQERFEEYRQSRAVERRLAEATAMTEAPDAVTPLAPFVLGMNRVAGAEFRPLNPQLAGYFGVGEGLLVTSVAEATPAAMAGLRPGDVIVEAGSMSLTTIDDLRRALTSRRDGAVLQVIRRGERMELTLR